jgi:hypothetical protein
MAIKIGIAHGQRPPSSPGEEFYELDDTSCIDEMLEALDEIGFQDGIVIWRDDDRTRGWWLAYPYTSYQGHNLVHRNLVDQYLGPTVERALNCINRGLHDKSEKYSMKVVPWYLWVQIKS